MTPDSEKLELDGHEVTLARGGAGSPLLMLHDVLGPRWEGLPDRLARHRTVMLPSLAGFPGSTYREDLDTMEDLAFWTLALLEQRGLVGTDVVGEGFGGWLAAEIASRWPSTFGRIALIAPFGIRLAASPPGPLFELRGEGLRRALFGDPASALAQRIEPDMPTSLEDFESKLTSDRAAARFAWRPYLHNPKLAARLARVDAPVLLVWGRDDRLFPPLYAEAWSRALPQARTAIVEHAGHVVGLERPDVAAERIEAFLATSR
jgi:pimeloyl-ACP methyl ester carboxylesterase